jgi:predicted Zn-dependent peptidase
MLLTLALAAQAQDLPFERYELPNGLQVVLHVDHSLPQVVVDTWYRVGSKDEVKGRSGFAHLFEHLMFMGTNRLPDNGFDTQMEKYGGWNNAWTMEDATNYYDVGPANLLPVFLWMEADRMEDLGNAMTQKKLDLQREVVRNERRQSYEDEPYGVAWLEVPRLLYPPGHPYDHSVIGSHEDLEAATLQDVKDFFATWYVPNNATIVVAGDFDPAAVKPLIEHDFGHLAGHPLPERVAPPQPTAPQLPKIEVQDDVEVPQADFFWISPAAYKPGDAELRLCASLLGDGESSRLYQKLVVTGLAQDVQVYQSPTLLSSNFLVQVTASEKGSLDQIESVVRSEIETLRSQPPTDSEMQRLKNQFEYTFLTGLESLQERAVKLNEYAAYTGSPDYLSQDLARFRNATAQGLSDAAKTWLDPQKMAKIVVLPKPATEAK